MCGRFYCDETNPSLRKVADAAENRDAARRLCRGEIRPADTVPMVIGREDGAHALFASWGYLNDRRQLSCVNVRCETVGNMRSYAADLSYRRCIVPATGYLECTETPERLFFFDPTGRQLLMAGLWRREYNGDYRFVLMTTDISPYAEGIHPRAPLLLSDSEARDWLFDDASVPYLLTRETPVLSYVKMPVGARID